MTLAKQRLADLEQISRQRPLTDAEQRACINAAYEARRAANRRELSRTDPVWRLTLRKDRWERRERKRRAAQ